MPTDWGQTTVGVHQLRVGPSRIDPLVSFLKDGVLPDDKREAEKIQIKASCFWLSKEQKLYKLSFLDHIYFVYTLRQWNHYWKNCMKEFMVVIREESPYHIGLSLRITSGRVCKKKLKIMPRSVINVRGLPQASINLEAC